VTFTFSVTACVRQRLRHPPSEDILSHKFRIGQLVNYLDRERAAGLYQVTQLLPSEDNSFQYRIKNSSEPHERMVKEYELRSVAPDASDVAARTLPKEVSHPTSEGQRAHRKGRGGPAGFKPWRRFG
jgi:hypothetical protein